MDLDSTEISKKVIIDFLCVFAVGFPILIFRLFGQPYKRGFYCDDLSIRYPFRHSTVPDYILYIVGIGLPVTVMFVFEVALSKKFNGNRQLYLFGWKIPPWLIRCYKEIGVFCFGAACSQLITDIGKYSIGRLRPHFITICNPKIDCNLPGHKYEYFLNFSCDDQSDPKLVRESRLSFPSGHSSFSAYSMVYLAIYLHSRMHWRGSHALKHFLQFCCIALSWGTALSRVSDYKHHWSDVLVGLIIGTTVAFLNANFVSDLFAVSTLKKKLSETTTLTNTSHQVMLVTNNSSSADI